MLMKHQNLPREHISIIIPLPGASVLHQQWKDTTELSNHIVRHSSHVKFTERYSTTAV